MSSSFTELMNRVPHLVPVLQSTRLKDILRDVKGVLKRATEG